MQAETGIGEGEGIPGGQVINNQGKTHIGLHNEAATVSIFGLIPQADRREN